MRFLPHKIFLSSGLICSLFAGEKITSIEEAAKRMEANYANNKKWAELRTQRIQAKEKPRRIIYNDDGDAIRSMETVSETGFLDVRMSGLKNSHVDAVSFCIGSPFTGVLYRSELFSLSKSASSLFVQLEKTAGEPLGLMEKFCASNGMDLLCSIRMNDVHHADKSIPRPQYTVDHPEHLLGKIKTPGINWTAEVGVDYDIPEVREAIIQMVRELCGKYAINGIELDFFRQPFFFKSVLNGGRATEDELSVMTDLIEKIRMVTEEKGIEKGRPILLMIRVPDSVEFCRAIGLDIETWMKLQLVDIMVVSDYFRFNDWAVSSTLGRRYGVKVYAGLSESRVGGSWKTSRTRNAEPAFFARAVTALEEGCDGLYTFNYFGTNEKYFSGTLESLRGKSKTYFQSVRSGKPSEFLVGGEDYFKRPRVTPDTPVRMMSGEILQVPLSIYENFETNVVAGKRISVTGTLDVDRTTAQGLEARVNGKVLPVKSENNFTYSFPIDYRELKKGVNRFSFSEKGGQSAKEWDFEYSAETLPRPPFNLFQYAPTTPRTLFEIKDKALHLVDNNPDRGMIVSYLYRWNMMSANEMKVEFTVKVAQGQATIIFATGAAMEILDIKTNQCESRISKLTHPLSLGNDYHTFLLLINRNNFALTESERPIFSGTLAQATTENYLSVAASDLGPGAPGEVFFRSVKFATPVKFCNIYDFSVDIKYP